MNIKRAKEEIKNTIEAYLLKDSYGAYTIPSIRQRPVLLIGPPGVGKTQIMEQISQECGIGLVAYTITHHTRQSAVGLPYIAERSYGGVKHSVTEYTMSEIVASIYDKIEMSGLKEGILFIDEINCVSETLAPTMLQFLQCKTFGNHKIPEGWIITAAGNPPEFNKSVRDFDVVTLDRIKMIYVEPNFEVWKEYAYRQSIHGAVISYLSAKKQYFCQIETTVDGKFFATPRGWEDLSCLIEVYEQLGKTVDRDVIYEYIQFPKAAKDFANYLELYYKYENDYQVEEILAGTIRETLCNKVSRAPFDEKLSVIGLLLSKLSSSFKDTMQLKLLTERVYGQLQILKGKLVKGRGFDSVMRQMEVLLEEYQAEWAEKKAAGLVNRSEEHRYLDSLSELERYLQTLKTEGPVASIDAWECLKELFAEQDRRYDTALETSGKMLEHGFDFMEAAFGDGQEMVVFVTELNTNYYCVGFLQEYECERYYQYNKKLLFAEQENTITRKMDQLGK